MAERVYQTVAGGAGGVFTLTIRLPDLSAATAAGGMIDLALQVVAEGTGARITQEAQAAFDFEPAASRFEAVAQVAPGLVRAGTQTEDPIVPFVEWDTAPHWPPFGPGSALSRWAERHGLRAWYVAKLISERGTTGRHAMERILQDAAPQFEEALTSAITAALNA